MSKADKPKTSKHKKSKKDALPSAIPQTTNGAANDSTPMLDGVAGMDLDTPSGTEKKRKREKDTEEVVDGEDEEARKAARKLKKKLKREAAAATEQTAQVVDDVAASTQEPKRKKEKKHKSSEASILLTCTMYIPLICVHETHRTSKQLVLQPLLRRRAQRQRRNISQPITSRLRLPESPWSRYSPSRSSRSQTRFVPHSLRSTNQLRYKRVHGQRCWQGKMSSALRKPEGELELLCS